MLLEPSNYEELIHRLGEQVYGSANSNSGVVAHGGALNARIRIAARRALYEISKRMAPEQKAKLIEDMTSAFADDLPGWMKDRDENI